MYDFTKDYFTLTRRDEVTRPTSRIAFSCRGSFIDLFRQSFLKVVGRYQRFKKVGVTVLRRARSLTKFIHAPLNILRIKNHASSDDRSMYSGLKSISDAGASKCCHASR